MKAAEGRRIPEAEYMADLERGLAEISDAIASSGLTISEIARGTRCNWETVSHASRGIPVRFDSFRRIMFFLRLYEQDK